MSPRRQHQPAPPPPQHRGAHALQMPWLEHSRLALVPFRVSATVTLAEDAVMSGRSPSSVKNVTSASERAGRWVGGRGACAVFRPGADAQPLSAEHMGLEAVTEISPML